MLLFFIQFPFFPLYVNSILSFLGTPSPLDFLGEVECQSFTHILLIAYQVYECLMDIIQQGPSLKMLLREKLVTIFCCEQDGCLLEQFLYKSHRCVYVREHVKYENMYVSSNFGLFSTAKKTPNHLCFVPLMKSGIKALGLDTKLFNMTIIFFIKLPYSFNLKLLSVFSKYNQTHSARPLEFETLYFFISKQSGKYHLLKQFYSENVKHMNFSSFLQTYKTSCSWHLDYSWLLSRQSNFQG